MLLFIFLNRLKICKGFYIIHSPGLCFKKLRNICNLRRLGYISAKAFNTRQIFLPADLKGTLSDLWNALALLPIQLLIPAVWIIRTLFNNSFWIWIVSVDGLYFIMFCNLHHLELDCCYHHHHGNRNFTFHKKDEFCCVW